MLACNSSAQEEDAGGWVVQGQPGLHREFEASLTTETVSKQTFEHPQNPKGLGGNKQGVDWAFLLTEAESMYSTTSLMCRVIVKGQENAELSEGKKTQTNKYSKEQNI